MLMLLGDARALLVVAVGAPPRSQGDTHSATKMSLSASTAYLLSELMMKSYWHRETSEWRCPHSASSHCVSPLYIFWSKRSHGKKGMTACSNTQDPSSRNHVSLSPYQVWHDGDIFMLPLWPSHNSRSDPNAPCVTNGFLCGWQARYHPYPVQWHRASHKEFRRAFKIRIWHDTHRWSEWGQDRCLAGW